jgi:hypothetical protein
LENKMNPNTPVSPPSSVKEALANGIPPDVLRSAELPIDPNAQLTDQQRQRLTDVTLIQDTTKAVVRSMMPDLTREVTRVAEQVVDTRLANIQDRRSKASKVDTYLGRGRDLSIIAGIGGAALLGMWGAVRAQALPDNRVVTVQMVPAGAAPEGNR